MKSAIFAAIAAFGAVILAFFVNFDDKNIAKTASNKSCDLNKNSCEVLFNGEKISFSFSQKPIKTMTPLTLKISGLSENFERLNARIYGLNMDMGTIRADFEKIDKIYIANLVINSCVVSVMNYRLELFDGEKQLKIFIDFDVFE